MSVLIKGMKMPRTCAGCEWSNLSYPNAWCRLEKKKTNLEVARTQRAAFCPFIEVPTPHGRLIDADFEEAHYTSMTVNPTPDVTKQDKRNSLVIIEALQMAKTIIEAEGSDK